MRTDWVCDVCSERFPTKDEAEAHEELHGYAFVIVIDGKKYVSRNAYIWSGENRTLRRLPRKHVGTEAMMSPDDYPLISGPDLNLLMRSPIGATSLPKVGTPTPKTEEKK